MNEMIARKVTVLRDVECVTWYPGEAPKNTTLSEGDVMGNVAGHAGGIRVVQKKSGIVFLSLRTADYHQVWDNIPADALHIEALRPGMRGLNPV